MLHAATIDEMFPRAEPMMRPPLPNLKTPVNYALIKQRAAQRGLTLTQDHWAVIEFILDFYEHCDDCENARALATLMCQEFDAQGGRKHLYKLFPEGPLCTIHEIANLPPLLYQEDCSSGTRF